MADLQVNNAVPSFDKVVSFTFNFHVEFLRRNTTLIALVRFRLTTLKPERVPALVGTDNRPIYQMANGPEIPVHRNQTAILIVAESFAYRTV